MNSADFPLTYLGSGPMTPDRTVTWDCYRAAGAELLVNPGVTPRLGELASLAFAYATQEVGQASYAHVADGQVRAGAQGQVYREDDLAIKRFDYPDDIESHGGRSLQANICLSVGLGRLPALTETRYDGIHTFAYSGPSYLMALMPNDPYGDIHPVWLMSYEEGNPATDAELPSSQRRIAHFSKALGACGLGAKGVRFDELDSHNTLSRGVVRTDSSIRHALVKFDITRAA